MPLYAKFIYLYKHLNSEHLSLEELLKTKIGHLHFLFPFEGELHNVSLIVNNEKSKLVIECNNSAILLLIIEGINTRIRVRVKLVQSHQTSNK